MKKKRPPVEKDFQEENSHKFGNLTVLIKFFIFAIE